MIQIKVTQEHIDRSVDALTESCPIEQAIEEKLGLSSARVNVGITTVLINGKSIPLTQRAREFVRDFDSGEEVFPSTFRFKE